MLRACPRRRRLLHRVSTTPASGGQDSQTRSSQVIGRSISRVDVGERRLHHRAAVDPHLVDRQIAEIADVPDLAGDAVLLGHGGRSRDKRELSPAAAPRQTVSPGSGLARRRRTRSRPAALSIARRRIRLGDRALDQIHVADEPRDPARIRLLVDFRRRRRPGPAGRDPSRRCGRRRSSPLPGRG